MKKISIVAALVAAFAFSAVAETYYWVNTLNARYPDSGIQFNTAADSTGVFGPSWDTYADPANDIIFQAAGSTDVRLSENSLIEWNANSYTMLDGFEARQEERANSVFNGGDIIAAGNFQINNGLDGGTRSITGSAEVQLGSYTMGLGAAFGSAAGTVEFGLNVVGDGIIDLEWQNANVGWTLNQLSSSFTGLIDAGRYDGVLTLTGNGAVAADVLLANNNTRLGRLTANNITVGSLNIEGEVIAPGTYTVAQLVTIGSNAGKDFSDNLIDAGGTITVIPEPATMGLFGLAGAALLFARRMKMV